MRFIQGIGKKPNLPSHKMIFFRMLDDKAEEKYGVHFTFYFNQFNNPFEKNVYYGKYYEFEPEIEDLGMQYLKEYHRKGLIDYKNPIVFLRLGGV